MVDFKGKVLYVFLLIMLLVLSVGFGFFKMRGFNINVDNVSALDFANEYVFFNPQKAVTASTKTIDVTVNYVDYYTICKEEEKTSKVIYGTTIDSVKDLEKEYQEKNGLSYDIDEVTEDSITYKRVIKGNCPNHFKVIYEEDRLNVYTVKGENKFELLMSIDDLNLDNIREELKVKIMRGTYINSKPELNRFIEDLQT